MKKSHDLRDALGEPSIPNSDGTVYALCGRRVGPAIGDEYRIDNRTRRPVIDCETCREDAALLGLDR